MEYVPKVNIFGLKLMVKRGMYRKNYQKILHDQNYFPYFKFIKLAKIANSVTKITLFVHGGILKKCGYVLELVMYIW